MKIYWIIFFGVFHKTAFFLLLIFFSTALRAQIYGCHVQRGMSGVIYDTPYGVGPPSEWQTVIFGTVAVGGETGGYKNNNTSNGCIADIGGVCTIYQQYDMGGGSIGMRYYRTGTYASIKPTNCPIDDYIPALFIFATGIFYFRSKIYR